MKTHSSFHLLPVASETRRLESVTGTEIGGDRNFTLRDWLFLPLFCLLVGRDPVCVRFRFVERVALSLEPVRIREEPSSAEQSSPFLRKTCSVLKHQNQTQIQWHFNQYSRRNLFAFTWLKIISLRPTWLFLSIFTQIFSSQPYPYPSHPLIAVEQENH